MNAKIFQTKLNSFNDSLEKQYLEELESLDLSLDNYSQYSLSFISSNETSKAIDKIFIDKCSAWKIGDKFKKIETVFYPSSERYVESIVWEIVDISISYTSQVNKYFFTYWVNEEDYKKKDFFKNELFHHLESIDIIDETGIRTKYHIEKI